MLSATSLGIALIGVLCIAFAAFGLLRGVTWLGIYYVQKDEEPIFFWFSVAMNSVLGLLILYAAWAQS